MEEQLSTGIQFKNRHPLYLDSRLAELLDPNRGEGVVPSAIQEWRDKEIREIIVLYDNRSSESPNNIDRFTEEIREHSFQVKKVSQEFILEENFEQIRKFNSYVIRTLGEHSCLLLFHSAQAQEIQSFPATLLINSPRSPLSPEQAIQQVTGRIDINESDNRVFRFKKFLNPDYTLPDFVTPIDGEKVLSDGSGESEEDSDKVGDISESRKVTDENGQNALETGLPPFIRAARDGSKDEEEHRDRISLVEESIRTDQRKDDVGQTLGERRPTLFKRSHISIRVKMLSIISLIIVAALTGMIFVAGYFYTQDTIVRQQERNLNVASMLATRVEHEINNIVLQAHLLFQDNPVASTGDPARTYKSLENMILAIKAGKKGDVLQLERIIEQREAMKINDIPRGKILKTVQLNSEIFSASFKGRTVVQNISAGYPVPLLAVGFPYRPNPDSQILIVILESSEFLKSFQTGDIISAFLINDRGFVIAHTDSRLVLSGANLSKLEIVRRMMESNIDNRQMRYEDANGVSHFGSFKKLNQYSLGIVTTAPEDLVLQAVNKIQLRNFIIMISILILAILVVLFYSRTITVPISKLVHATKLIEDGEFEVYIKPETGDEIGILTNSLINMAAGLQEREKIKEAFGKFVNRELVERAMHEELRLGGERKNCAIFFSDLRDFTGFSETLEPEELVEILNEYFTHMVNWIYLSNGIVDKFMGDAIMAHWGAIISNDNDTERAINTALLMRLTLVEMNRHAAEKKRPHLNFGCAINTGPVIAGQIGAEYRHEFTIVGDAVNLTQRIEAMNKPLGTDILITQSALDMVPGIFVVEEVPPMRLKGKREKQRIHAVLGRKDDPQCPKSIEEVQEKIGLQRKFQRN